jgi:hypothetical protein
MAFLSLGNLNKCLGSMAYVLDKKLLIKDLLSAEKKMIQHAITERRTDISWCVLLEKLGHFYDNVFRDF